MKLVLLTGEDCPVCEEAVDKFKKDFFRELDNGEAKIVNLDADEAAQEMWMSNDLPLAPIVLLVTDKDRVISHIETKDLLAGLKEASPAGEAEKTAVESSGHSQV